MQTQPPHWRRLMLPLAFALACLLLMLATYRSFGGSLPLEAKGYRVQVPLPSASNLVEGSDVQISGVDVGRVVDLRRARGGAVATIDLERRFTPLHNGARAIVRTKTLLGEGYLEIAPGPPSAPILREGQQLAASQVTRSVALDEMLRTFPASTRGRLKRVFAGLSSALRGRATALNDTLAQTAGFSTDLAAVLQTLAPQTAELQRLVGRSGDVFATVGDREGLLRAAIRNGEAVLDTTAARDREIAGVVRAMPPFLSALRRTSDALAAASPELVAATEALEPVAPLVRPALDAIQRASPSFTGLFRRLPATIDAGRRGLPSLTRIFGALTPALDATYPAARELIPLMDLLGDYRRQALIGPLANGGAFTNGRVVGPGGKILGRAGGTVTVWNESIGGYVKRLPTSRANPYPKPGALDSLATTGVLNSFDCRHTGNPLLVPPTGTGTPPCVTQGAWTYRGKSAFYPRLLIAPP